MVSIGGDDAPKLFKDWQITQERELIVPERVKKQQAMLAEENERLRKLGLPVKEAISQAPQVFTYGKGNVLEAKERIGVWT
jgi:hypothetical protein